MTQEEIQKLAEELFQIKEIDYAELIGYTHADLREDARMRFADGYTTCQQTEVEPLQKEIERLKGLLEKSVVGYLPEAPANRIWAEYCKDNNL